jgi:hypothetical protein
MNGSLLLGKGSYSARVICASSLAAIGLLSFAQTG